MPPPRILDPSVVPVIGTDAHLAALPPSRLSPQALRRRFAPEATGGVWQPEFAGDGLTSAPFAPAAPGRLAAAVLVPLLQRDDGLHVLLTRRSEHLRDHAGQISFPGGRSEPDDGGAAGTALREAEEEVGLPRHRVEIIGQLPTYATVTNFVVTPVVGLVAAPFDLTELALDRFEVAEAFAVPLAFLMTPQHHRRHRYAYAGGEREFLSMAWRARGPDGSEREYFIWGATAAMLRNLYTFLAA